MQSIRCLIGCIEDNIKNLNTVYKEILFRLSPKDASSEDVLREVSAKELKIKPSRIVRLDVVRRSIDARRKDVLLQLTLGVHVDVIEERERMFIPQYRDVSSEKPVIVVGAGPAGIYAALRLIERGMRPIVLERGKSVEERRRDIQKLYRREGVDADSNFAFGEGGAGTFSDGKLYTRSKKRGNVARAMEILVYHGADPGILIDSHPHIGTDKLAKIIVNMRHTIIKYGGEVLFSARVDDLILENKKIKGVVAAGKEYRADNAIFATGHSARDVYRMLNRHKVILEPKDFAIGLRLEHPQHEIDCIQYHNKSGRGEYLPAAEYSFVTNIDDRGVYSFCMCPGGVVVPASTGPCQQVVNGMSSSRRNGQWANSAMVTSVGGKELAAMRYKGLFGGLDFQGALEEKAFVAGGSNLTAPGQLLPDFINNKTSSVLPRTSYTLGASSVNLREMLPSILGDRLAKGLDVFGRKASGFISQNALLLGVETRTSSPIRIPRNERCMHIEIEGLYPCAEGAGYAGGIISAAMDGEKCAEMIEIPFNL